VRLDAVEGALAQILTAMSTQLGEQTETLATMNAALGQTLDALGQMNETLGAIKGLLAKDVEVRDELADLIDRRAQEIVGTQLRSESDPAPVPHRP
jgi:inorganic triphosphatase YgiF